MTQGNFVVYRSSAGSGKTYTLVKEYLALVLRTENPEYYRHVLAITFTNKAANEMKERVIGRLTSFSNDPTIDSMAPTLMSELGLSMDQLQHRSQMVLRHMIHHFGLVSISTIDGFVHRLIRGFAQEMGLAYDFEASTDTEFFLAESVDRLLDLAGDQKDLTRMLLSFIEGQMDEEKSWDIRKQLVEFSKELLNESAQMPLEALRTAEPATFSEVRKHCSKVVRGYEGEMKAIAADFLQASDQNGLEDADFSGKKILAKFRKQARGEQEEFTDNQLIQLLEGPWYSGTTKQDRKDFIDAAMGQMDGLLKRLAANREQYESYVFLKAVLRYLMSGALLAELDQSGQEYREEENVLLVSDFHRLVSEVIGDNPAPFIYERIGERYKHFLIDEFQDTSMLQWKNFLPLIDNSLAGANFCMLVGDGKQAIYRWRNGDVRQFNMLPKTPWSAENPFIDQTLQSQYAERVLDTNYRSSKEIIDFNNQLFGILARTLGEHQSLYDNHDQKVFSDKPGYVSVIPTVKLQGEESQVVDLVVNSVSESLEDGFMNSDIAVLVRTKKEGVRIARALLSRGIPVVTEDSLALGGNAEVQLLVAVLLRDKSNAELEVSIVKAISFLSNNLRFSTLMEEFSELTDYGRVVDFNRLLSKIFGQLHDMRNELSLYSQLENWVNFFGFRKTNVFIDTLMNEVHRQAQAGSTLAQFSDWWENKGQSMIVPIVSQSGVQIMTIHKSKGLQFPVVIYPIVVGNGSNPNIWVSTGDRLDIPYAYMAYSSTMAEMFGAEFEEEKGLAQVDAINMHYVALTRPEKRLYCIFETTKNPPKADTVKGQLDAAFKEIFGSRLMDRADIGVRAKVQMDPPEDSSVLVEDIFSGPFTRATTIVTGNADELDRELDPREYGSVIHSILEKLDEEDPSEVIDDLLLEGSVGASDVKRIQEDIRLILSNPKMNVWYTAGHALNEADLIDEKGRRHRPDRVVFFEDHIEVIDFKTGEASDSHHKQVREYVDLISEVEIRPVTGHLFYTKTLNHVEVS